MCVFRPLHGRQYCQGRKAKGARLKKHAVPSIFAWTAKSEQESSRRKRPCDRAISKPAVQFARVRIHIERAINPAKNFTIFDKVIPLSLAGSINQIWTVCCLLTNFLPPLLEA